MTASTSIPKRPPPDFAKKWPRLTHAKAVYECLVDGLSQVETATKVGISYTLLVRSYRDVIRQARLDDPHAVKRREAAERFLRGMGQGLDMAEVTRLASLGMPDKLIAQKLQITEETLVKYCRKEIDLARATLAQDLAEKIVAAAQGSHAALERIVDLLEKEVEERKGISDGTLQVVLDIMNKEMEKPNLLIAEKLLGRLGFYDVPLDGTLRVDVRFDDDGKGISVTAKGTKAEPVD